MSSINNSIQYFCRIVEFVDVEHANQAVATMNGVPHGYKNIPLKVRLDRK